MPDLPISRLPPAALPLSGNEQFPCVQSFVTVRAPIRALAGVGRRGQAGPRGQRGPPGEPATNVVYSQIFLNITAQINPFNIWTPDTDCLIRISTNSWVMQISTVISDTQTIDVIVTDPSGGPTGNGLFIVQVGVSPQAQFQYQPFVLTAKAGVPITLGTSSFAAGTGWSYAFILVIEKLYPTKGKFMDPTVVQALSLTGLAADVVNQILYVPPATGVFRLSFYAVVTTPDSGAEQHCAERDMG